MPGRTANAGRVAPRRPPRARRAATGGPCTPRRHLPTGERLLEETAPGHLVRGQTRLPYRIGLHERRWHGGLRHPRSSSDGQRSPSHPFVSAAINSRGRPRPGGRETAGCREASLLGGGSGTKRCPPAAQRPMQSPDRAAVAAAGPPTHSFRLCHLPVQSEPRSPSTPRHCGGLAACPDASPVSLDAPTPASCFARRRRRGRGRTRRVGLSQPAEWRVVVEWRGRADRWRRWRTAT